MRRKLIAGNWKMNGSRTDAAALGRDLSGRMARHGGAACDWLVCPPFPYLAQLAELLRGSGIALGAQDCHAEAKGAFTGDVAAPMLADVGCSHVIVGHSERRHGHGETSAQVCAKAAAAQAAGLVPIVCVGETEHEYEAGKTLAVLEAQLADSLPEDPGFVVAYEPVWAIGTGKTATTEDVASAHDHIRGTLRHRYGDAGAAVRILYGGSVKPANAADLLAVPEVGGALVGGASLKADDFWAIGQGAG